MAGHHADTTEDAVLGRDHLEPFIVVTSIARIHRESGNSVEPCRSRKSVAYIGDAARRNAAAAFDAPVAVVYFLGEFVIHAFFDRVGIERIFCVNPGLALFRHFPKPDTCIYRQIAYQLEHGQRVQPN